MAYVGTAGLVAGDTHNITVVLYNEYDVEILDPNYCQQLAKWTGDYHWVVTFNRLHHTHQFPNFSELIYYAEPYCDSIGFLIIDYNITVADDYQVEVFWFQNTTTPTILIGSANTDKGIHSLQIVPAELVPSTIIVGDIPSIVNTDANFTLVGFDHWGNLADFSGTQGSLLSIDLSPHCIFNYPPVCTPGNTSYVCHFNVSVGGIYCLSILYDGQTIGNQSVYNLLVQGGYLCESSCQNAGYCLVTSFPTSSNSSSNVSTNSTNGTNPAFAGISAQCHCAEGFTGTDCSVELSKSYMRLGLAIGLIVGLALLLLIIGLLIGFFVARSRANKDESGYLNRGLVDN
jgi:hypothetical protein